MKIKYILLLLLAGIFSCQSDPGNDIKKEEIKKILTDYYTAMSNQDISKIKELTTPDFVLYDGGYIYNNESAVKAMEKKDSLKVWFKFDSLNVRFGKADASTYYLREMNFTSNSMWKMSFLESATFEKRNGKWKLRFLHSSKRN